MKKDNTIIFKLLKNDGLLHLASLLLFIMDLVILVDMIILGIEELLPPQIIKVALEAFFIAYIIGTNFKFRYSIFTTIIFFIIFVSSSISFIYTGLNYFTMFALIGYAVPMFTVYLLFIILIINIINNKRVLPIRKVTRGLIFTVCCAASIFVTVSSGIFGQGFTGRQVEYIYNQKTDSYIASGKTLGSNKNLVIKTIFNNKDVSKASMSLFSIYGVESVTLENPDIAIDTNITINQLGNLKHIYVAKDKTNDFVKSTWTKIKALKSTASSKQQVIELYTKMLNAITPIVYDDEVYVKYTYTADDLDTLLLHNNNPLKIYISKKGKTLKLSDISNDNSYLNNYNLTSEEYLKYCYNNLNHKVFNGLLDNNTNILNKTINKSYDVTLDYANIIKVLVLDDNDTLYTSYYENEPSNTYHYALSNNLVSITSKVQPRSGFDSVTWYSVVNSNETTINPNNNFSVSTLSIKPSWSISTPNATLAASFTETYNNSLTINPSVVELVTDSTIHYNYSYSWKKASSMSVVCSTKDYSFNNLDTTDKGEYVLTLTISAPETSLTKTVTLNTTINVNPIVTTINWNNVNSRTYDGTTHVVSIDNENPVNNLVSGDSIGTTFNVLKDNLSSTADVLHNGVYTITYTGSYDTEKYSITNTSVSFTVSKVNLVYVWDDNSLTTTYNGEYQSPRVIVKAVNENDDDTLVEDNIGISVSSYRLVQNGGYTITPILTGKQTSLNDYVITGTKSKTFTINPKVAEFDYSNVLATYDKNSHKPTVVVNNLVSGDTCNVTIESITNVYYDNDGNVSAKKLYVTALSNANYTYVGSDSNYCEFTLNPKNLTFSWGNLEVIYNATNQIPSVSVNGKVLSDSVTVTLDTTGKKDAGEYIVKVVKLSNSNYIFDKDANNSQTNFTIYKRKLTVSWSNLSLVYNGLPQVPTITFGNLSGNDTCTLVSLGDNYSNMVNVNNYYIILTKYMELSNNNYTLEGVISNMSKTFTITRRPVSLSWTNTNVDYNGEDQKPNCTVTNLCGSDTLDVSYLSKKDSGTYTIYANSISGNDNYTLTNGTNTSTKFTINKLVATISWGNDITYDGSNHNPTYTLNGLLDPTNDSYFIALSDPVKNAGTYNVQVKSFTSTNYTLESASYNHDFIIKPIVCEFAWSNTTVTYNGTAQSPAVTLTNKVDGDTVTLTVDKKTLAKTYDDVKVSSVSNTNYTLVGSTTNICSFTINPITVTFDFSNTTTTYNGSNQLPTVNVNNVLSGDVCNATLSTTYKNAGSYEVSVIGLSNDNYTFVNDNACKTSFTINPIVCEFNWSNLSVTYNGNPQKPTITISNKVANDNVVVTCEEFTDAGVYTCHITSISDNDNYTLTGSDIDEQFTINKKEVTISFSNNNVTYNGENQTVVAEVIGLVQNTTVNPIWNGTTHYTNVGVYNLEITGVDNDNYKLNSNATCTLTINPIELSVNVVNSSAEYDGDNHHAELELVGVLADDDCSIDYTGNIYNEVGNYQITELLLDGDDSINYTLPVLSIGFEITSVAPQGDN